MFQRALQNLFLLRALPDASVPNEPSPISGQTPAASLLPGLSGPTRPDDSDSTTVSP
jgi:hypothetical protein